MPKCSVKKCKNNTLTTLKKNGVSYFRFPKNEVHREKWRQIVANERGEEFFKPNESSVVCSCHFSENDLYFTKKGYRKIKKGVLPQIEGILSTTLTASTLGSLGNGPSTSREESSELQGGLSDTDSTDQPLDDELHHNENEEFEIEYYESDAEEPRPKQPALASVFFVKEEDTKEESTLTDNASTTIPDAQASRVEESDAYGRAVSLQLQHLDSFQRTVAEKLISNAIFYARLNKLSANSYINLNSDKIEE